MKTTPAKRMDESCQFLKRNRSFTLSSEGLTRYTVKSTTAANMTGEYPPPQAADCRTETAMRGFLSNFAYYTAVGRCTLLAL
jgi:hypothetical protein